jgi:hypothetical protein
MKTTIQSLATKLGGNLTTGNVNGFIKVLEATGKATKAGQGPKPARGRAATIYEISQSTADELGLVKDGDSVE